MFERLRLSDTFEWVTGNVFDKFAYFLVNLVINGSSLIVVLKSHSIKTDYHDSMQSGWISTRLI